MWVLVRVWVRVWVRAWVRVRVEVRVARAPVDLRTNWYYRTVNLCVNNIMH